MNPPKNRSEYKFLLSGGVGTRQPTISPQLANWRRIKHEGTFSQKRELVSSAEFERAFGSPRRKRTLETLVVDDTELLIGTPSVELEWLFLSLQRAAPLIGQYVVLRQQIDKSIRAGSNLKAAKQLTDKLLTDFGCSFAGLERWMLVNLRLRNDGVVSSKVGKILTSNIEAIAKFTVAAQSFRLNPVVPAHYYRKLAEANVKLINTDESTRSFARWLIGISNPNDFETDEDICRLIYISGTLSPIDRYELLFSLLLKCNLIWADNSIKQVVLSGLRTLSRSIDDYQLNWISGTGNDPRMLSRLLTSLPKRSQNDQQLIDEFGDGVELFRAAFDPNIVAHTPFVALHDWLIRQPQSLFSTVCENFLGAFECSDGSDKAYRIFSQIDPAIRSEIDRVHSIRDETPDLIPVIAHSLNEGKLAAAHEFLVVWLEEVKIRKNSVELSRKIVNLKRKASPGFGIIANDEEIRRIIADARLEDPDDLPVLLAFSSISDSEMDVSIRIEEYLDALGLTYPSTLLPLLSEELASMFPMFVQEVCSLNQLEHLPLVGTSEEDVIRERLALLRQLSEFNADAKASAQNEIAELVKLERICSMEKIMDASRLLVDVGVIEDRVKNFFDKTETYSLIPDELHQVVLGVFLLDEDHGLDAELSNRIRHGKLRERLLSPFIENQLIANDPKELADAPHFNPSGRNKKKIRTRVASLLKKFSSDIQEKVNFFGEERAQLRVIDLSWKGFPGLLTAKTAPQGLICVTRLKEESYEIFEQYLESAAEAEDFDVILRASTEAIWSGLETQLAEARDIISDDWFEELSKCLGGFERELSEIIAGFSHEPISRCRSQLRSICEEVAGWFVRPSQVTLPSSRFDEVVELAKRAVETSGWGPFEVNLHNDIGGIVIESDLVGDLYDLLVLLLSNAGKHGSRTERCFVDIGMTSDFSSLVVSNSGSETLMEDVKEARRLLDLAKRGANREALNREGKSGMAKIVRQLRRIDRSTSVAVEVDERDNRFELTLKCETILGGKQ